VLLGRDDRAVLTDFGIATFQGDPRLTQTGMVMGSPGFTAPERIRGEDASPASDLWSLGATLYAAVEGHGPFEQRGGAVTTMSAIINEDAPPAPAAGALGPVIAALLRREPADRPDASAATRMINDALRMMPTGAGREPVGYEPTSLSAPASPRARTPVVPGETSVDSRSARPTAGGDPFGALSAADTHGGGESAPGGTAATTPQPVLGDVTRHDEAAHERPTQYRARSPHDQVTQYDPKGRWGPGGPASGSAAPPPDFSSWYDPSPRSGPAPSAQPWSDAGYQAGSGQRQGAGPPGSGAAAPSGARPDYPAPVPAPAPRRRRTGLWIALILLALLGAGAGAATIVLLRHSTSSTPSGQGSSPPASTGTGTLPPAALQIVDAVNTRPGALPSGWATVTHHATGTQTAGFTIAAPTSWLPSTTGNQTYVRDPSANASILIDLTPHTFPNDMLREAEYIRDQSLAKNRFPGYVGLGLAAETIRGTPGAWWKFTWVENGVNQEAIDLLFVLQTPAGPQSYALYMTAPASMWSQMRPIFDEEVETFSPLT